MTLTLPNPRYWLAGVTYDDSEARAHRFNGQMLLSATQVLKLAGKSADFANVRQDRLEYAGQRGTAAHAAAHFFDEGDLDETTVDPRIAPYFGAWKQFREERFFVPDLLETVVFSRKHGYIGRLDRFGHVGRRRILLDIKTGDPNAARTDLQLVGYELALMEEFPELSVETLERWSVQLLPTGRYRTCQYPQKGRTWRHDRDEFLDALHDAQLASGINWRTPAMVIDMHAAPPEPPDAIDAPPPEPPDAVLTMTLDAPPEPNDLPPDEPPDAAPVEPADALVTLPAVFRDEAITGLDRWINEKNVAVVKAQTLSVLIRKMDKAAMAEGTEYAATLKAFLDAAKAFFDPIVAEARAPYQRRLNERKAVVDDLEAAYKLLSGKDGALTYFVNEERRIAAAEEARLQREADERARKEREAEMQRARLEEQRAAKLREEAAAAERAGQAEQAAQLQAQATEQQRASQDTARAAMAIQAPVVKVETTMPAKTRGGATVVAKDDWTFRVDDHQQFVLAIARPHILKEIATALRAGELTHGHTNPLTITVIADKLDAMVRELPMIASRYVLPNEDDLRKRAKADQDTGEPWPGVTFYNRGNVSIRNARAK